MSSNRKSTISTLPLAPPDCDTVNVPGMLTTPQMAQRANTSNGTCMVTRVSEAHGVVSQICRTDRIGTGKLLLPCCKVTEMPPSVVGRGSPVATAGVDSLYARPYTVT